MSSKHETITITLPVTIAESRHLSSAAFDLILVVDGDEAIITSSYEVKHAIMEARKALPPPVCTDVDAVECPVHGQCKCRSLHDPSCPLHSPTSTHGQEGHETGLTPGELDSSGEMRLELEVDGHKGNLWLSKEMWETLGEMAGWRMSALQQAIARRFRCFADGWQRETGHLSNLEKRLSHPDYRAIVAMGWPVVPFLLGEFAGEDPDFWGPALREITGEHITIDLKDHGRQKVIAAAWLELAKKKGWQVQSAP